MIKKVYEVYPLIYPSCASTMKIIAFIQDHKVIDKIIHHLNLSVQAERPPSPHVAQHVLLMAVEDSGGISEGLCGCFLSTLREKSILFWIVLQFISICLSCLSLNMSFRM